MGRIGDDAAEEGLRQDDIVEVSSFGLLSLHLHTEPLRALESGKSLLG